MPTTERSPVVARRALRLRLIQLRLDAGKSQNEIADALDWSPSKIFRIEKGENTISTSDVIALVTQFESIDEESLNELKELAREARRPTVASRYRGVLTKPFSDWLDYESSATEIRQYETKFVPGILQTDDYATAVVNALLGADADDAEVKQRVEARIDRARHLVGSKGPKIWFIVDEEVLRRAVGNEQGLRGHDVMLEQLAYLKRMNTVGRRKRNEPIEESLNPNISIQVVPFELGTYPAMRGPFELIQFDREDVDPMMYFENPEGDVVVRESTEATSRYLDLFAGLKRRLQEPATTNDQIDQVIELMRAGRNGISEGSVESERTRT